MLKRKIPSVTYKICLLVLCGLTFHPLTAVGQDDKKVDFVKSIKPIFEQHCLSCHGEVDPENFRIDLKEESMDYIDAGSAEDSNMHQVLVSDDEEELMPPADEENPLSEEQIEVVKAWIDQGADWPDDVQWVVTESPDSSGSNQDATAEGNGTDIKADNGENDDAAAPAVDPKIQRLFNAIGSLHTAAVHLPIGLLLASGLFALFSLRGNFVMSDCAYYCLWLGALGAIIACLTGWWCSPLESKGTVEVVADLWDDTQPVYWHRLSGIIVTIFALLLALFAASARNRDPDDGILWKLGLIVLAGGIGFVGHEGGELTHGKHHYDDLNEIGAELLPSVFGKAAEVPDAGEQKEGDSTVDGTGDDSQTEGDQAEEGQAKEDTLDEVGKTSDET